MSVPAPKSLRSILTLWFLTFSIVPLGLISIYSSILYERAINTELQKRLEGNIREVGVNLIELESYLQNYGKVHAADPSLSYHVATRNIPSARRIITDWLRTYTASRIIIFDREGRLVVSQQKAGADIKNQVNL